MFNSGIKVNQRYTVWSEIPSDIELLLNANIFRCNGVKTSPSLDQLHLNNKTVLHINHNNKHKLASKDAYNSEERRDRRFIMGPDTISNPFLHSSNNSEFVDTKVKLEPEDIVFDNYGYSIIGTTLLFFVCRNNFKVFRCRRSNCKKWTSEYICSKS